LSYVIFEKKTEKGAKIFPKKRKKETKRQRKGDEMGYRGKT
jgi:hypothetical protein